MAGLTINGFQARTLEEILAQIEELERELIDPNLNQEADSVVGQINGIVAAQILQLEELAQEIYAATFPDNAVGVPLSNLSSLTGVTRRPATKGSVIIQIAGTPTTIIPAGTLVSVQGDSASQYEFTAAWTIITAGADLVTVEAVVPGDGPNATVGDIGVIDTPVTGFDSFTFATNAERGLNTESDAELRARRELELARPGTGTVPAIEADLAQVEDVSSVTVFENTTESPTDETGLPIHNVEAVVGGGVGSNEQALADQLWASKPAGIGTFGADSRTVTDDAGNQYEIFFSRPISVATQIDIRVQRDVNAVSDDEIRVAIVEYVQGLRLGEDVTIAGVVNVVMDLAGVLNVPTTQVLIGKFPGTFFNEDLEILDREQATISISQVTVTEVA